MSTNDSQPQNPRPDESDAAGGPLGSTGEHPNPQAPEPRQTPPTGQAADPNTDRFRSAQTGAIPPGPTPPSADPTVPQPTPTEQMPHGWEATDSPEGAPPATGPGGPTGPRPAKPKRKVGKIVAVSLVAVLLVVVILGAGSELFLRSRVKDCLSKGFSATTGTSTSVSISSKPILLQWIGTVPYVQVDTRNDGSNPNVMKLHLRGENVDLQNSSTHIGNATGSGYVPFTKIADNMNAAAGQSNSTSTTTTDNSGTTDSSAAGGSTDQSPTANLVLTQPITGNPTAGTVHAVGTVTVSVLGIPVKPTIDTTIKPVLNNGKLSFQVESATASNLSVLGFQLPGSFDVQSIAQTFANDFAKQLLPGGLDSLTFTQMQVTDSGVNFAFAGSNLTLEQTTDTQVTGNDFSCSIL